jgi:hypothetical protein
MTRELKEIARREVPVLVRELIRLATKAESEAVRVAAIKEMFDRGFGKATQPVEGSLTYGISEPLASCSRRTQAIRWVRRSRVALLCRLRTARNRTDMDGR